MPLFVRVSADADGEDPEIDEVRVAVENIHLARDHRGHTLVYDAEFNQVVDDKSEVIFDGYMRATTVTEERRDWPVEDLVSRNDQWRLGPDPRHEPDAYLDDDELDDW